MNTKHQDSFYYGYTAIKSSIDSGEKTNSLITQFNEQTSSWAVNTIIDYINYIKSQNYRGDAWGNGHEIFMDLKKTLDLKLELHKLNAPAPNFTRLLTSTQLKYLYTGLTTDGFLPTDPTGVDYKSFCYVFGRIGGTEYLKPLKWLKSKQLLRELLTPIIHSEAILADVEKIVPIYFIDKKGNIMNLANQKYSESNESDKIKELINNLATL